ncbi:nitrate/nitrite two-component system sensor histidine kinase NarQ [Photobacterium damselae subsp. damselae]|nr:nitrate/nitrite two-component system sensor histidine kinase NarQ [Photobacterium damselae subsp. damselae]NVO81285.1 nitrate/nitrite two-component system sensor histidine kinase NarQ [Photobacterium damselae subsp. damselae]
MPSRPFKPVTTTIARAMLCILLLSVITTSFALLTLASSLNDAEAVNVSGSLRMQSYRLAYDIQTHSEQLPHHIAKFEHSLFAEPMAELDSLIVPRRIKLHYYSLIDRWHELKPDSLAKQQKYLTNVADFVTRIDKFVFELQEFSITKLRMLAVLGGMGLTLILCVALFVIHFTQRQVVTPLNRLVSASKRIKQGEFDLHLAITNNNELGLLTNTFNTMASELGKLYHGLEQKVNEKTHRLRHANDSLQILYQCSQELSVSRLSEENFHTMLNTLVALEGLTAVKLSISESNGHQYEIESGVVDIHCSWHYQDLAIDGEVLGQLWWQYSLPCPDQALIDNIARILARGIYYNRAQKQTEQLLIMEERATIARELHDSLAQSLSYLKIQLTLLKRQINKDNSQQAKEILTDIEQGLSGAYTQLRELLSTFRLTVAEADFAQALTTMVEPLEEQTNAVIVVDNQLSSLHLQAHHQIHLLQVIREALLNAIKHANADEILIRCLQQDDKIAISIKDDGDGFDPRNPKLNHYGLAIMNERAARLHGQLEIHTQPQKGCEIELTFLLPKEDQNE